MAENSIYDRPRTRQPCPPHRVAPRNTKQTLRELFTENETRTQIIPVLKNLSATRPKGPWRDYWSFYTTNQSGDVQSFKPEGLAYIKKMIKDVNAEWAKQQGEGEEDDTEKEQVEEDPKGKRPNTSKSGKAS